MTPSTPNTHRTPTTTPPLPQIWKKCEEDLHIVCHSYRQLVGFSTDLVIYQVLMRSIKTTGGLTKCQGMDETWRANAFWILSCSMHAEFNHTMQEFTGVNCNTMSSTNIAILHARKDTAITWQLITVWSVTSIFTPSSELLIIDLVCVCVCVCRWCFSWLWRNH